MDNYIDELEVELKEKNDVKLVIWGGAQLGLKVAAWLDARNIKYDAIAVNREYWKDGDGFVILEDYVEEYVCSLIVGFACYRDEMLEELRKDHIAKVYAYDFQGRFAIGEDSVITRQMLEEHSEELKQLKDNLSDEKSLIALEDYIHQKMYSQYRKKYSDKHQYFDDEIISFGKGECFVDCGGYDGADTKTFFECVDNDSMASAFIFEPNPISCKSIIQRFENDDRIKIYNIGTGDTNAKYHFDSEEGTSSKVSASGGIVIEIDKLDNVIGDINVTFLKMDVEGFELKTLHGAEKIIKRCRPKMAICIYHRSEDLWTIPQYILSLHNDYKLYIRSYHPSGTETVLYAI
jgi:FkbM family methyltransferase